MKRASLLVGLALGASVAAQPAGAEWKEFISKPGAFRVLLPGIPHELRDSVKGAAVPIEVVLFLLEPRKGEGTYGVGYSVVPVSALLAADPEKRLRHARDQAVARAKGKLHSDRPIRLDGFPGREFEIEVEGKVRIRTRLFAVKKRLYQLLVTGPDDWLRSPDPSRFFDSFQLRD
jgi:hypothetical protein